MTKDEQDLNQLATFHYVWGGISVFFACLPLIYMLVGLLLLVAPELMNDMESDEEFPVQIMGILFAAGGLFAFILSQAIAICIILSGKFLAHRKNYMFSFIMACFICMMFPFGSILGIFTIITLSRESVKQQVYHTNVKIF